MQLLATYNAKVIAVVYITCTYFGDESTAVLVIAAF